MAIVLGILVVVSGALGVTWIVVGVKWALARRRATARAQKIEGEIVGVEKKEVRSGYTARGQRRRNLETDPLKFAFHPKIAFTTPGGDRREFVAPSCEIATKSPYVIGSKIAVCFDPGGQAPPSLDSFSGRWAPSIAVGCGGFLFTAVSIGLGWVFYAKVIQG